MDPPPLTTARSGKRARAPPRVVAVLAGLLERAAERGDTEGADTVSSAFRGRALPGIPVRRYAERIYRYAGCSPACFVVAYVYLDRLLLGAAVAGGEDDDDDESPAASAVPVRIDSYTVHRLLITSVLVAAKFMDDRHNNNAYFARVGGVEVAEMNALELHLLFALRFRLNVSPDTFARYCAELECQIVAGADAAMAAPLTMPPPPSSTVVSDSDEPAAAVTSSKAGKNKSAAATAAAASSTVPIVVVDSSHHHHRRVAAVQIMTTAQ